MSTPDYRLRRTSSTALALSGEVTRHNCTSFSGQWLVLNSLASRVWGRSLLFQAHPQPSADGVAVDSHSAPSIIQLTLTCSKTDQFRRGSHTFLGKTGSNLCPVEALLQFLTRRPGPRVGPLFIHEDSRPPTRDQFVSHLKEALSS